MPRSSALLSLLAATVTGLAGCPQFRSGYADVPSTDAPLDAGADLGPVVDVPAQDAVDAGLVDATLDLPDTSHTDRLEVDAPDAGGLDAPDVTTADVVDVLDVLDVAAADRPEVPDVPDVPVMDAAVEAAVDVPVDAATDTPVDRGPPEDSGLSVPRPIGPPTGSIVTARRPTLRWDLMGDLVGASVQVCRDRACSTPEAAFDQRGYAAPVTADLPPGVHYWRIRGLLFSGAHLDTWSDTWEFWVSPLAPPRENAFGAVPDLDGDGIPDVVIGAPAAEGGAGRVYVWRGPVGATPPAPAVVLTSADGSRGFGAVVTCVGDVNGDGYVDLGVSAYDDATSRGTVEIFQGGPGLSLLRGARLTATEGLTFGFSLDGAGDSNNDGYADVIVGQPQAMGGRGRAHVYLGRRAGLNPTASVSLRGSDEIGSNFGWSVAGQGDFDGDTIGDVVVGARGVAADHVGAYAYTGTNTGFFPTVYNRLTIDGDPTSAYGSVVASVGDVNDDGFSDVVVGAPGDGTARGRVLLYLGWGLGLTTNPRANIQATAIPAGSFGAAVTGLGDVDGDGVGDLAVGAPALGGIGRVTVVSGSRASTGALTRTELDGAAADGYFGGALANLDPVTRSLLVGAPREATTDGRVRGFDPTATALPITAARVFSAGTRGRFGASIAGIW